ncbi:MAG: triose-phosphate isomerase [Acidobacteria bacterium]|nr:triose-phosphate isomerase [Acidobacteriota bacterium]MYJ05629.1 triose-phosphate isomerase [Acidobacteriota bacterium]
MRTPVLAANWKMHKTIAEAVAFTETFLPLVADADHAEIVLAPPFTALAAVAAACHGSNVATAGQDVHWEAQGAFTGEVSLAMLAEAGASHVIVGHSERRQLFGETDETVNRKARAALAGGLAPIVCVGETLDQREADETEAVLDRQVAGSLAGFDAAQVGTVIVAYEPVWAIGTGRTATPDQAQAAHAHIRSRLAGLAGDDAAASCRLLYGGSVKPGNAAELAARPDVDGALVGGASLDPASFARIVVATR